MKIIQSKKNIFLICFLYFICAWFLLPDSPIIEPDSSGYINFSSSRTSLYPLVISFVLHFFGDIYFISFLQIIFFSLSSFILMREIVASGFRVLVPLLALVLFLNPFFWLFHITVLTDSLFLSFSIFLCALLLALVRNPQNMVTWLMLGGVVGLSIELRPVGFSFLPMIPITYFYVFNKRESAKRKFIFTCLTVPLMIFAAGKVFHYSVHGPSENSLTSRHIFAKSALLSAGESSFPESSLHGKVWNDLEADAVDVRRLLEQSLYVNPGVSGFLLQNYEVYFQYRYTSDMLRKYPSLSDDNLNEVILEVGLARLRENPLGYIGLTARHFSSLWQPFSSSFPPYVKSGNNFIEAKSPLPFNENKWAIPRILEPRMFSVVAYPSAVLVGMVSILLLILQVIYLFKKENIDRIWIRPLLMSLTINGNFLLISMLGVGIGRYSLAMFVPMLLMILFVLCGLFEKKFFRLTPTRASD